MFVTRCLLFMFMLQCYGDGHIPLSVKRKAVDLVDLVIRANEEMALVEDVRRVMDSYESYGTGVQSAIDRSSCVGLTCLLLRRLDLVSMLKSKLMVMFPSVIEKSQSGGTLDESEEIAEACNETVIDSKLCNSEIESECFLFVRH